MAFLEGEVLHYTFNGGAEQTVTYDETPNGDGVYVWSNNPNYDPNYEGLVEDPCEAGTLEAWTTSGSATSEKRYRRRIKRHHRSAGNDYEDCQRH